MPLDPRCALLLLLAYLATLSSVPTGANLLLLILCALPLLALLASPLPKAELLAQSAYVLPFSFALAAVALLRGNLPQAVFLLVRSYFSILAALLVTRWLTPLELVRALERLGAPRFLIIVTEFLLRYLEVLRNEADSLRLAALCRGGSHNRLIATSSLAMLFVRSLERSTSIHNAMLARGFRGQLPRPTPLLWRALDTLCLLTGITTLATLRYSL